MRAEQLIGQQVLRTKPAGGDYSYSSGSPIVILHADENHVVFKYAEGTWEARTFDNNEKKVLDTRWADDGWRSYDELMIKVNANARAIRIISSIVALPSIVLNTIKARLTRVVAFIAKA